MGKTAPTYSSLELFHAPTSARSTTEKRWPFDSAAWPLEKLHWLVNAAAWPSWALNLAVTQWLGMKIFSTSLYIMDIHI